MEIAHLVLAHKLPGQLERMIKAMAHPSFDFYIHVDGKVDITPFLYLSELPRVHFIQNRTVVYWADYGTVQATLNGFEEILKAEKQYDYINVMSGQDFPVKSPEYIYEYINARKGSEFINCYSIYEPNRRYAIERIRGYHLLNTKIPGRYRLSKITGKIMPKRKFPLKDYTIAVGSNWFTLTSSTAGYILSFIQQHPEVVRYFKYSPCADELIFATILYNAPMKNKVVTHLLHTQWSEDKKIYPAILTPAHLNTLKTTDRLWARKFDSKINSSILDILEEWIHSKAEATLPVN